MPCLTLTQLIALETGIVTLLMYLSSMFIPEVRRFLQPEPQIQRRRRHNPSTLGDCLGTIAALTW